MKDLFVYISLYLVNLFIFVMMGEKQLAMIWIHLWIDTLLVALAINLYKKELLKDNFFRVKIWFVSIAILSPMFLYHLGMFFFLLNEKIS